MLYRVLEGPRHGRLTLSGGTRSVRSFSQDDVNKERLSYEHREQEQFADFFRFDVSCGNERRRGLQFGVDILPAMIPMEVTGNLTVPYGGSSTLTSGLLKITRQRFEVCETLLLFL